MVLLTEAMALKTFDGWILYLDLRTVHLFLFLIFSVSKWNIRSELYTYM